MQQHLTTSVDGTGPDRSPPRLGVSDGDNVSSALDHVPVVAGQHHDAVVASSLIEQSLQVLDRCQRPIGAARVVLG